MKQYSGVFLSFVSVCIAALTFGPLRNLSGQTDHQESNPSTNLYEEIKQADAAFFEAFNNRDLETIMQLFTKDLEFFHDEAGLSSYEQNIEATKRLFDRNNGLKRTLVEGSIEVYPVKDYGAIQIGSHEFCHPVNGVQDCGTFQFVHIWKKEGDTWKIARVISYGH